MGHTIEKIWKTEAGLKACVLRVSWSGHLCGYVEIPKDSPFFGVDYSEKTAFARKYFDAMMQDEGIGKRSTIDIFCAVNGIGAGFLFDAHGGVTYSGSAYWDGDSGFWYGYDCAHCGDGVGCFSDGEKKTLPYCEAECESLARQIVHIGEWVASYAA